MSGDDFVTDQARTDWLRHACEWSLLSARPKRLGVAVSGGSDSLALLDLMIWHARKKKFEIRAVTVNHGLRDEARQECEHVAAFCAARDTPHDVLDWKWDGAGNLQAQARKARYTLIANWANQKGVDCVALGHTENDQAETVLMRMARQAGVDGLAGMSDRFERHDVKWIRPLLRQPRAFLMDYLRSQGIDWCSDPSNADETFERVRARKAVQCLAEVGIDPSTLATIAGNAAQARWALDHYAWREVTENGVVETDRGDLILPERFPTPENNVPSEVGRRLMIGVLMWISGAEYPPRRAALINIDVGMLEAMRHTVCGCLITRKRGKRPIQNRLRITREYNAIKDIASPTDALWDGRWRLDGPHSPDLEIRALGEAVKDCPDWRDTGLPRTSLLASPAIWHGDTLIAAPLAGLTNGWSAHATGRGTLAQFLLSR